MFNYDQSLKTGQSTSRVGQTGNNPLRWDRSGTVVEVKEHDQYEVKMVDLED